MKVVFDFPPNGAYRFMCAHHMCELEGDGHGVGMGMESFPYFSTYREGDVLTIQMDMSELACPLCKEDCTDEEMQECQDSWEAVPYEDTVERS